MSATLEASILPEPGSFIVKRGYWTDRPARGVPPKQDVMFALEETRDFLLSIGSAWETVPTNIRLPALEQAHKLEELQLRNVSRSHKDRDETYRQRRRLQMRHPDTDLNALGGPCGTD
jgi:hypothetical protein